VGTNWDAGLIYWKDHAPSPTVRYSLLHLHPFVQVIELPASDRHPARSVGLHVSFGLHTFTRAIGAYDGGHELYGDNRETRTFCATRYKRSGQGSDPLPRPSRTHAPRHHSATAAVMQRLENAKPRLRRGFVSPDPLTSHRGGPLGRRAYTEPAFVHEGSVCLKGSRDKSHCAIRDGLLGQFAKSLN
jgi:hypothetical protein